MSGQNMPLQGCHLPWNRAQRRRHSQAKELVIHLYAGESAKEWDHGWPPGLEVITLDVLNGQNVHDPATWAYVWGTSWFWKSHCGHWWATLYVCESNVGKTAWTTKT